MISIEKAFDIAKQFGETNGHIIRSQYCLDDLSYFGIIPKEYEKKETIPLIEIAYVVNMTTGDIIKCPMFQMIEAINNKSTKRIDSSGLSLTSTTY